jgi:hypothetical protein
MILNFQCGSSSMTYIPSFIKIGSGIKKLLARILIHTHTNTQIHKGTQPSMQSHMPTNMFF